MSLKDIVITTDTKYPDAILIQGVDGVGKTTFAAQSEKPLFIGPERGLNRIKGPDGKPIPRLPAVTDFQEFTSQLEMIHKDEHDFKTLVVDSVDWVEHMIHADACRDHGVKNIDEIGGGWSKWKQVMPTYWTWFRDALEGLRRDRGMNVILIAHTNIKSFADPVTNSSYDRYIIGMKDDAAKLLREWAGTVLFANFVTHIKKEKYKKDQAIGVGNRALYTERRPAFDAKNRDSLPFQMDLNWDSFIKHIHADNDEKGETLVANLIDMLEGQPQDFKDKVMASIKSAKKDISKLTEIRDRLDSIVNTDKTEMLHAGGSK